MGWGGRWEGGSGWGNECTPWRIHVNVWQKPPRYCKVINLLLKKQTNKSSSTLKSNFIKFGNPVFLLRKKFHFEINIDRNQVG